MNERVVVALQNTDMINQMLSVLDTPFNDSMGRRVLVHDNPVLYQTTRGSAAANFDLVIVGDGRSSEVAGSGIWADVPAVHIQYLDKVMQHRMLRGMRTGDIQPRFTANLSLGSTAIGFQNKLAKAIDPIWLSLDYLIKPTDGARGIGQVLVRNQGYPVEQQIDPITVMNQILNHRNDDGVVVEYSDDDPVGDGIRKLQEVFGDRIQYQTHGENYPGEGLGKLRSGNVYLQEYVPNIVTEYRVLTNYAGDLVYIQERVRRGKGYQQAIGSGLSNGKEVVNHNHREAIAELLAEMVGWCGKRVEGGKCSLLGGMSFDFYITTEGDVGLLEMSTQYGYMGVPRGIVSEIQQQYIVALIDDVLPEHTGE